MSKGIRIRLLCCTKLYQGYLLQDIGVISPFRAQAEALKEHLRDQFNQLDFNSVGTIHTFQGSEKEVIILSTKVCSYQDNVSWINRRPNLLNVAVSRAKELFILVGNLYRLEKAEGYTCQLVEHIREQGVILRSCQDVITFWRSKSLRFLANSLRRFSSSRA